MNFQDMNFQQRLEWMRGYLLIAIGEGSFQEATYTICQSFTLWPLKSSVKIVKIKKPKSKRGYLTARKEHRQFQARKKR